MIFDPLLSDFDRNFIRSVLDGLKGARPWWRRSCVPEFDPDADIDLAAVSVTLALGRQINRADIRASLKIKTTLM